MNPSHSTPLDLAGQVTWLAWTLQEIPIASPAVTPILQQALKLGGIQEFRNLRYRKAKGQTVFGQIEAYPQATANDTAALIKAIADQLAALPEIVVPQGEYLNPGDEWQETIIPASEMAIADTKYSAPLDISQDLAQPPPTNL